MTRVLVVDDEPQILRALRINLRARHIDVHVAATGAEALRTAARHPPDLVILDLGLPDLDGVEVIGGLRGWTSAPIIVLSGRASPGDKIGALDVGADDYVTKPFSMAELLARLRAALRRDESHAHGAAVAIIGLCIIDLAAHTVTRRPAQSEEAGDAGQAGSKADKPLTGETVRLTPTEWRILETLVRRPGQLVSSRQMLTEPGMGYRYQP